ncbi:MAG TPA: hypothetical protein VJJ77_09460 [Dongiaceae bacterium]|nr:hypothetical protein [Dongiaceae bacterium]
MAKVTGLFLAALFATALVLPGAASADCNGMHSVQGASTTVVDGSGTAPITPIPAPKTGG